MSTKAINFIAENPRSTAKEAGLTTAEAVALVGRGLLLQAGHRKTGKKGRPPVEYVVPGYDLSNDPEAQKAVEAAKDRVQMHRHWERLSNAIMRAANEFGNGSSAHLEAKANRAETFIAPPPLPSTNDYVLAGVIEEETPLPDLLDEVE